jgi:juvenile hormone epoxide hydrolase
MGHILKLVFVIITVFIAYQISKLYETPPIPKLEDTWWGPRDPSKEDTSIQPFKIDISDSVLKDLQHRLANARPLTPPLEGVQHQYGINTKLLNNIVEFWRTKYNWREREKFLNQFPQFKVSVQGLRIHYIHVKPSNPGGLKVLPLLLLHGWPGSVREFYGLIPLLTKPRAGQDFVFEVIVPSLPGYGFSEAAVRPGLGAIEMSVVFKNFMKRLGFEKYYIHGGDWGAVIVQHMAALFPEQIEGVHSSMCSVNSFLANVKLLVGSIYPPLIVSKEYENKVYPLSTFFSNLMLEMGYMHLQATKPDTVGVGLNDSPVGLAAYILEKFITWTNSEWKNLEDGGLTKKFTYTDLLDNVMIYWVTGSITTSVRLYSETVNKAQMALGVDGIPVTVPSACARFPNELAYSPTIILKEKYHNLVHVSDYQDGGHFASFELPKVMAEDIFTATEKMRSFNTTQT